VLNLSVDWTWVFGGLIGFWLPCGFSCRCRFSLKSKFGVGSGLMSGLRIIHPSHASLLSPLDIKYRYAYDYNGKLRYDLNHMITYNSLLQNKSQYDCWGEDKDATLRSRPSLQSLVWQRQNGQGHPSLDSAPDEGLRRRHPTVRPRPAQRPTCDPAHCNGPCVAAACYGPYL
jgi:hypothetical protein